MASLKWSGLNLFLLAVLVAVVSLTSGQYSRECTNRLEDIPDPSSDSCQSFYRCYRRRQYSLRCPLGQVFDFDRSRCRQANSVNCQLQLQRFQAPAVPGYMWPNQRGPQDGEVEIRVVHVAPDAAGALPSQNPNQALPPRSPSAQPARQGQGAESSAGRQAQQGQGQGQGQNQGQGQALGLPQPNGIPDFLATSPLTSA